MAALKYSIWIQHSPVRACSCHESRTSILRVSLQEELEENHALSDVSQASAFSERSACSVCWPHKCQKLSQPAAKAFILPFYTARTPTTIKTRQHELFQSPGLTIDQSETSIWSHLVALPRGDPRLEERCREEVVRIERSVRGFGFRAAFRIPGPSLALLGMGTSL